MMLRNLLFVLLNLLLSLQAFTQHPAREKIDSLKKRLPLTKGMERIDCLNALSEEYWWPPRVWPDSISLWAKSAYDESAKINYPLGLANATMHLGVSEIYRVNFLSAEKYLRHSLQMFEILQNVPGIAWADLWLGQTLYSENKFADALAHLEKSVVLLKMLGDWEGEGKAWAWMGFSYAAVGNYDSSFEYCQKSLLIRKKMSDNVCVAAALINMGQLYKTAGDYQDALNYYTEGLEYANTHAINARTLSWNYLDEPLGTIYRLMDKLDSSVDYLQKAILIDPENQMTRISLGETFLIKEQYDSALKIFLIPIKHFREQNDRWDLMRVLLDVAKAYAGKQNDALAFRYAQEGFSIAQEANLKPYMVQGYLLFSNLYKKMHKNDSAYYFMAQFIDLKDSVTNKQFLWKLTNYTKETDFKKQIEQVALLAKDNNIKKEKLKNEALIKWSLAIGLLVIAMSSVIVFRSITLKRKNEKLRSESDQAVLKQNAAELEMQALRAQMNPHFIFNSLNSINRFILQNNRQQASEYLTKFSRLVRMILQNSQASLITLESELESLSLYLEMEALRFNHHFTYKVSVPPDLDLSGLKVPPLIIQPYTENAIWHGLMHKEEKGHLDIELWQENDHLFFKITDDGVGRKQSAHLSSKSATKYKSLGLKITADRIAILQQINKHESPVKINDLLHADGSAAGTEVIIKIPVIYD